MSRNYELLSQIGKAPVAIDPDVSPATTASAEVSPEMSLPFSLQIEGTAKNEIAGLVHRLFISPSGEAPRRVAFVCTESGVGNSWLCAHVAAVLASQVAGSVCLVDCNFRSPTLYQLLGVQNSVGLADSLTKNGSIRQYVQQLGRNLWMVSSGVMTDNAEQLLTSNRMRQRLSELSAEFDYVIMDVASLDSCNHGMILGATCDGVVLVLKANSSRRETARQALQQLRAVNIRVLGAVLNQRTFPIPDKIYRLLHTI
jgi:capsular exopolysaccharide synthesis family protein